MLLSAIDLGILDEGINASSPASSFLKASATRASNILEVLLFPFLCSDIFSPAYAKIKMKIK
jgi:hypothetical protein